MSGSVRRWRFWTCILYGRSDPTGLREYERDIFEPCSKRSAVQRAKRVIRRLKRQYGIPAKIYAPLPEHANSGHVHVLALISRNGLKLLETEETL